ncbi:MAG: LysM peptidoglycan-binding domain-containing protein, partial [Elusimicrobiota bacterium]|nr:LysM peptidoglycan-binding domain-containing protein [Elusimicrobiota bacterium]
YQHEQRHIEFANSNFAKNHPLAYKILSYEFLPELSLEEIGISLLEIVSSVLEMVSSVKLSINKSIKIVAVAVKPRTFTTLILAGITTAVAVLMSMINAGTAVAAEIVTRGAQVVGIVEKGDSLWKIAKEYLISQGGNPINSQIFNFVQKIISQNPQIANNPDLIHPGNEIVLDTVQQVAQQVPQVVEQATQAVQEPSVIQNIFSAIHSFGDSVYTSIQHAISTGDIWYIAAAFVTVVVAILGYKTYKKYKQAKEKGRGKKVERSQPVPTVQTVKTVKTVEEAIKYINETYKVNIKYSKSLGKYKPETLINKAEKLNEYELPITATTLRYNPETLRTRAVVLSELPSPVPIVVSNLTKKFQELIVLFREVAEQPAKQPALLEIPEVVPKKVGKILEVPCGAGKTLIKAITALKIITGKNIDELKELIKEKGIDIFDFQKKAVEDFCNQLEKTTISKNPNIH